MVVRGAGRGRVTWQRRERLVSADLPTRKTQADRDGAEGVSGNCVVEAG